MGQTNIEKKFFKYLKNECLNNNFIHLNYPYLPTDAIGKLNRFYLDKEDTWVSRLKLSDSEKIYYFGFKEDIPNTIIKFNEQPYKSCIKFVKEQVAILIKIDNDNVYNEINKFFTLKYATNDNSSGYYYLILGSIGSNKLIKNIKTLIKKFIFEIELNKNEVNVLDYIKNPPPGDYDQNYKDMLKLNLKTIELKNNILKKNFDYEVLQKLKKYIFDEYVDNDIIFNPNFKNKFDEKDNKLIDILNLSILKINNKMTFDEIIEKITYDIKNYKNTAETCVQKEKKSYEVKLFDAHYY